MTGTPLISVVTPSFNQARFIRETLQSLVDQDYPNLEVVIQDGGSSDGAVEIAKEFVAKHPGVFQLFVEKDNGQADALNRGFAKAKGEILGFLNSDDTLYPGCLLRVAKEIEPVRKRLIVFGRCLFTGEDSPYVGVEHPAIYASHFEHLAIWKRGHNTIPQPSVFWHRTVWEKCGGFNLEDNHVLDYDLFCRFSRHFHFYKIDELWSTYRMHAVSKSSQRTEDEVLKLSTQVSRRYWGGWWSPLRWRCAFSHWLHDRHMHEQARHHARRAEDAALAGRRLTALGEFFRTGFFSPSLAWRRLFRAWLRSWRIRFFDRILFTPDTGYFGHHADGWIGPVYRTTLTVPAKATRLVMRLRFVPQPGHGRIGVLLKLNGKAVVRHIAKAEGDFSIEADLSRFRKSGCSLELACDSFFVPSQITDSLDTRQLSLLLLETRVDPITSD
jgi:glycosyltransferase involved in cell wall biosynthesis